jgi:hypothetical protein
MAATNWFAGQKGRASQLTQGTIIAWGYRTTASTVNGTATDIGVIRLDNVAVVSGRSYSIRTNSLNPLSTVGTDNVRCQVRYRTDGTPAGITDTALPGGQGYSAGNGGNWPTLTFDIQYIPSGNQTLSLLLCVARQAGSGSVNLFADGTRVTELKVMDCGIDVGNTAVNL